MWFDEHLQSVPTWYDLSLVSLQILNPISSLQISIKHSDLQSVPVHKRIYSSSLLFSFDKFLWNGISSLEWICWKLMQGVCTVTVMVIRLLFHLESNIMMTLKLDMKHICKKEVRRGGYFGLGWGLWEAGGELCTDAERTAGSSELLWGGDPDVGPRLLLDD